LEEVLKTVPLTKKVKKLLKEEYELKAIVNKRRRE
jgi:hypothetical protein